MYTVIQVILYDQDIKVSILRLFNFYCSAQSEFFSNQIYASNIFNSDRCHLCPHQSNKLSSCMCFYGCSSFTYRITSFFLPPITTKAAAPRCLWSCQLWITMVREKSCEWSCYLMNGLCAHESDADFWSLSHWFLAQWALIFKMLYQVISSLLKKCLARSALFHSLANA